MNLENETRSEDDRRAFLKKCGRFAVITPPAVTFLLSTSMSSKAIASSGRGGFPGGGGDSAFGVLAVGAGTTAAGIGAGALSREEQVLPERQLAPVEAPPAPFVPPPPPAPPPPPPEYYSAGERG